MPEALSKNSFVEARKLWGTSCGFRKKKNCIVEHFTKNSFSLTLLDAQVIKRKQKKKENQCLLRSIRTWSRSLPSTDKWDFACVRWVKVIFWLMISIDRYLLPLVQRRPSICFHLLRQLSEFFFPFRNYRWVYGIGDGKSLCLWLECNWLAFKPFFRFQLKSFGDKLSEKRFFFRNQFSISFKPYLSQKSNRHAFSEASFGQTYNDFEIHAI